MSVQPVLNEIDSNLDQSVEHLLDFLRIPSISTDPAFNQDCQDAADWLVEDLKSLGIDAKKRETAGHPMVVGHSDPIPNAPHILFYGHYDVQPVDPLALWDTPPFEPAVEQIANKKVIRGRGASDDKGQLMTFIEACRAWIKVHGALPVQVSFFFEGEEESGSPSLVPFMQGHAQELSADVALICDTGLFQSKTPAIMTQLRGLYSEDFTIAGPDRDLHSGMYGGIAMNPIRVLTKILAGLHDETGRITLSNFYDGVPDLPDEIRQQWEGLGFDYKSFLGGVGLSQLAGEHGRMPLEMIWSQPTCDVNGIWGGYTGDGFKTVLPSEASAKISFRLVGQQNPEAIRHSFRTYLTDNLPADFSITYRDSDASPGVQITTTHPIFETARIALSEEWPEAAAFVGCGGSIPIAGYFKEILGMDAMLVGFAKDDDNIHSPNEKYDLESFHKGIRSWVRLLSKLA